MRDEMLHPSVSGEKAVFELFIPFVKVKDPITKEWFMSILKELYRIGGDYWTPGSCYAAERMVEDIKSDQNQGNLIDLDYEARNFANAHYFLVVRKGNKELIIDPFGVPLGNSGESEYMDNKRLISPFFGEIGMAPNRHKSIYLKSDKEEVFHHMSI